jgi:hypothetical protein
MSCAYSLFVSTLNLRNNANRQGWEMTRTLRMCQIACIALVLFCLLMVFQIPTSSGRNSSPAMQWIAIAGALSCAVEGFNMQKKILRGPRNRRVGSKSTPVSRWMVGNVLRIAFAVSVSLWGFLSHIYGSPGWLAVSLIGVGLILLLIWRPGSCPASEDQTAQTT